MSTSAFRIAEFKSEGSGLFAALVSAFNNDDLNGDRMMPGAFSRTIEEWRARKRPIPVVWSHGHENPEDFIGEVDPADVKETDAGLVVAGKLFVDRSERAASIFDLMKRGLISAWSFAFTTKDERIADDGVREVLDVDLIEVGPTLVGANPDAQTIALKALDTKSPPARPSAVTPRGTRRSRTCGRGTRTCRTQPVGRLRRSGDGASPLPPPRP